MDFGSVLHAILLGEGKEFSAIDADDFKTKAARQARDAARSAGKVPILRHALDDAKEIAPRLLSQLETLGVVLSGQSEVAALWSEVAENGAVVPCRGMLDHWREDIATIYDLKIVRSAHPRACQSHLVGFGGDIQAAAYTRAVEFAKPELAGRVRFVFLFCEPNTGAITPATLAGTMRGLGEARWRRAVNRWARCTEEDHWPAYVESAVSIEAPQWALYAESDTNFTEEWSRLAEPDGPSDEGAHDFGAANHEYEDPSSCF